MGSLLCLTLCSLFLYIYGFTCDHYLEEPEDVKVTLAELQTAQPMEIVKCLAHLGRDQLPPEETKFIWKCIVSFYKGTINVPESVLSLLHWITPALEPDDYLNITLSNIDVIQNFGFNYNLSEEQLSAIADRVREDFGGKEPDDYTFYDLTAIRQILCAFNRSEIERIRPSVYRETAIMIGKLDKCPTHVFQGFAVLAVQNTAFGDPGNWSDSVVQLVGAIANFVGKTPGQKKIDE